VLKYLQILREKAKHEKEMAIIEKQKIEIMERGKKDVVELEIKKLVTKSDIEDSKSESSSVHGDEDYTGGTTLGGHGKIEVRGPRLSQFEDKDDIDSYIHRFEQYAKLN